MTTQATTFDFPTWVATYPEFSGLSVPQGQAYFNQACLLFANSTTNPSFCDGTLPALLYLATSHVAWLMCPKDANGNPSATGTISPLVGRVSSAAQGSVNVSTEFKGSGAPGEDYWNQTKYGAQFWAATAQYRTARYLARPTIVVTPPYPAFFNRRL